jgi:DNA invertase Pin-like site-specific DNA recombinase
MVYGYARCSTNENKQDIDRQVRELVQEGAEKVFLEYEQGISSVKKELDAFFELAKPGDTLITTEVSRLSRSTSQLCDIVERIKTKKLKLVIKGSIEVDCRNGAIDPMSNAFLQILGVFSELEREMLVARVKSGLENAKAKGVRLGRPSLDKNNIPQLFYKYYPDYTNGRINKVEFARLCNVSRQMLYRYLKIIDGQ